MSFPYTVVLTTGSISINDATGTQTLINYRMVTDVAVHAKTVRVYGLANGDSAWEPETDSPFASRANNATLSQDNYPDPGDASTLSNSQISATPFVQWFVRVRSDEGWFQDLPMGQISNQGTWVNTQAGAEIAVAAIRTTCTPA